jgi:hypothetical protein
LNVGKKHDNIVATPVELFQRCFRRFTFDNMELACLKQRGDQLTLQNIVLDNKGDSALSRNKFHVASFGMGRSSLSEPIPFTRFGFQKSEPAASLHQSD